MVGINRVTRNWLILSSAGFTLLGSVAFGYLAGQLFWQGALLATSILGIGLPLTSWEVLWLEQDDRPSEDLLILVSRLADLLDQYLRQLQIEQMEGWV